MCLSPYNDLKSAVWNCSYVCTNLILDHMISLGKEAFELTSLQMSGFLFAHPSNYQLIHPPTSLSGIHPPTLLAISILPPTYHPTYPPTHQSIHLFLHPPTHSSAHPSAHPSPIQPAHSSIHSLTCWPEELYLQIISWNIFPVREVTGSACPTRIQLLVASLDSKNGTLWLH